MSLRVLFVPFGSEGDVNPLLWLAQGMADRGHKIEFLITPHYSRIVEKQGFSWTPLGTEGDFLSFARNPLLWHPHRGPEFVVRGMLETLPAYQEALEKLPRPIDLIVTSTFALGAACFAEKQNIPRLTIHMQPVCLRSIEDFPLFLPELAWVCQAPIWFRRLFYKMVDATLQLTIQRPFNVFRRRMGLPASSNFYAKVVNGASGVAALFPDWFAPPQPEWPPHLRQFGFPLSQDSRTLPETLERFFSSGPPPVLWTHGSANFDIVHFQSRALETCSKLQQRCLLVSLNRPDGPLPPHAFHVSHVKFEDVFPHCSAIVHHGGIGTTSKAIMSGVPQLIIPRSHDQPDNARRIVRLGLGQTLKYSSLDTPAVSKVLREVLESDMIRTKCLEYKARILSGDKLGELCDWAESLAEKS